MKRTNSLLFGGPRILVTVALGAALLSSGSAQVGNVGAVSDEEPVVLPPFEVETDQDSYYASNALSATRARFAIAELPSSIQVITSQLLEDFDVSDLGETLRYANNVTRVDDGQSQSFVGSDFQIRGFQAPEKRNGMESFTFVNADIIERLELPKGPQSVLYGQASPGGVINYVTKKASFKPFSGRVTGFFGGDDYYKASLDTGGTLTDDLAWRLVTTYRHEGGFQKYQELIDTLIYPALAWRISDRALLNVSFEYLDRAQTRITRPMSYSDLGLSGIVPAPDGTPADQLVTGAGGFQVWQASDFYSFGSDPRVFSLEGPLNRDKGYGQFAKSKVLHGELTVNLADNLDLRVAAQRSMIDRKSHNRMAEVLNFRLDARTNSLSYRERKRYQDAEADEIQTDLVHKFEVTLPFLGKTTFNTLLGFEWEEIGSTDGAIETNRNTGQVLPLEGIFPDALEAIMRINGVTRQDLVNMGSELLGTPSVDPRLMPLSPDSAFLTADGKFVRGNIDRIETDQTAFYLNEVIAMKDNRFRLMGGFRRDDNGYAGVSLTNDWNLDEEGRTIYDSAGDSWMLGASVSLVENRGIIDYINAFASTSTSWSANNTRVEYRIATDVGEFGTDGTSAGFGYVNDPLNPGFPFRAVYKLADPIPLGPEEGKGKDFGIKFSAFGNKVIGSVSFYDIERNGIVRTTYMLKPIDASRYNAATFDPANPPTFPGLTGLSLPTLSGFETSEGLEIELNLRPTPNWDIYLGLALAESEVVTNDQDPSSIGRNLPFTPGSSFKSVVKYTFAEGILDGLTLGSGIDYWDTSYHSSSLGARYSESGPLTIYGAFASYRLAETEKYKATLRFNIDNIQDTIYADKGFRWGQPRTVRGGITVTF